MCEISPLLGGTVIGLSVGFFTLLSINFANAYKKKQAIKLEGDENA